MLHVNGKHIEFASGPRLDCGTLDYTFRECTPAIMHETGVPTQAQYCRNPRI